MLEFDVKGMSCGHCVKAITQAIKETDAGSEVQVDLATKKVKVKTTTPRQQVEGAIVEAGFEVTGCQEN